MLRKASKLSRPGKVKQKEFKPKNNLPHLENYSVDLPQSYWDKWNKLTFSEANYSSWLNPQEFVKVAEETGYNDMKHVEFVSESPLTTRMKPKRSSRLILDLSYPHTRGIKLGMGIPMSVNSGINTDLYKTEMSSTTLWLNSMRCGGVGALLSKMDWESAYKHVHVHRSDLKLQVFKFCNR